MIKALTYTEWKAALTAAVVTGLLYTSGFFVILTPFPLFFVALSYGKEVRQVTLMIVLGLALAVYLLLFPLLEGWTLPAIGAKAVFLLPGGVLTEFLGLRGAQYFGFFYLFYFLLFGYLFSEGFFRQWPTAKRILFSAGIPFAFLAVAAGGAAFLGVSLGDFLRNYFHGALGEILRAEDGFSAEKISFLRNNADNIVGFSIRIMPAVLLVLSLVVVLVNQGLARWLIRTPGLRRRETDWGHARLPEAFIWVPIGVGFLFFFNRYWGTATFIDSVVLNGAVVCGAVYFLQGFAIVSFHLCRVKSLWFRSLVYLLVFLFINITAPALVVAGLTDLWVDSRRLRKRKKSFGYREHKTKEE